MRQILKMSAAIAAILVVCAAGYFVSQHPEIVNPMLADFLKRH
jgi:hypothetical protein